MKKISLRNFQLKPTEYINDLPITLTRYGKPVAILSAPKKMRFDKKVTELTQNVINKKIQRDKNGYCHHNLIFCPTCKS